jgi:hypothetical protein
LFLFVAITSYRQKIPKNPEPISQTRMLTRAAPASNSWIPVCTGMTACPVIPVKTGIHDNEAKMGLLRRKGTPLMTCRQKITWALAPVLDLAKASQSKDFKGLAEDEHTDQVN